MRFDGKVALVTGGTRGIGRTAAFALGRAGASIVITGRDELAGADTLDALEEAKIVAHFVVADVVLPDSGRDAVDAVLARFGRLDVAFNNAGVAQAAPFLEETEDSWSTTLNTNLTGVWRSMQAELKVMTAQGYGGSIVNNASIWSLRGRVGLAGYSAAKHGVIGLTKTAALEFAPFGIRVNAVCPGTADTEMVRHLRPDDEELAALATTYPLGRLTTVDDVASAVLWLASDAASFVTGHALVVDGGFTAR
jgi:NAD(P)-dependent dehydrogenase (short-subunit alcohol dehydrogenase family)